jgi:hypothetical protein
VLVDELWVICITFSSNTEWILKSDSHSQDTSYIQFKLVKSLVPHECVTVVGDPDQSSTFRTGLCAAIIRTDHCYLIVYGWHAAERGNWLFMKDRKFLKFWSFFFAYVAFGWLDFPTLQEQEATVLEKNYRSTGSILALGHSIILQGTYSVSSLSCFVRTISSRSKPQCEKTGGHSALWCPSYSVVVCVQREWGQSPRYSWEVFCVLRKWLSNINLYVTELFSFCSTFKCFISRYWSRLLPGRHPF